MPTFTDVDGDGDYDAFVGVKNEEGEVFEVRFFENTGTPTDPNFVERTGDDNLLDFAGPLLTEYGGKYTGITPIAPTFVDIDGDRDPDAFIGTPKGPVHFFENKTPHVPIPSLGHAGLLLLPLALGAAGAMIIRRRKDRR
jgi:hypothetical protein